MGVVKTHGWGEGIKSSWVWLVKCPALWNEVKAQCAPGEKERKYFPPVGTQWSNWTRKAARKSGNISRQLAATLVLRAWLLPRSAQWGHNALPNALILRTSMCQSICHGVFAPWEKKVLWTRFQPLLVVFHSSFKYIRGTGSMPGVHMVDSLNQGRQVPALTELTS